VTNASRMMRAPTRRAGDATTTSIRASGGSGRDDRQERARIGLRGPPPPKRVPAWLEATHAPWKRRALTFTASDPAAEDAEGSGLQNQRDLTGDRARLPVVAEDRTRSAVARIDVASTSPARSSLEGGIS